MSEHVQTCLILFRFNMIWIVAIYTILKHVWTCSNLSILVQIQYDTNCYNLCNSQTCMNMLKHVQTCSDSIWYELLRFIGFLNLSKTCSDSIWHELIQFLNMSRLEMKTWWNTLKLSKWTKSFFQLKSDSLDRFEQVERSKTQIRKLNCHF